jgi:hypothetical protein
MNNLPASPANTATDNRLECIALLGSVAFGLLWIGSEFIHAGVLWEKTHNTFGKRVSEIRADTYGGYWPFMVDQQVGATANVRTKRVVLFLPNEPISRTTGTGNTAR